MAISNICAFAICGRKYGNYLVFFHLFTKLIYTLNAVAQFALLNSFLGSSSKYYTYGFQVLEHLVLGSDWEPSERFPRVTLCDFKVCAFKCDTNWRLPYKLSNILRKLFLQHLSSYLMPRFSAKSQGMPQDFHNRAYCLWVQPNKHMY